MIFETRSAAAASLREFSAASGLREAHTIVKFWSTEQQCWRYCRVLQSRSAKA